MERNRMYRMTEDERSSSATALFAPRKEGHVTRKLVKQPGSMELIELGDQRIEKERPPSEPSARSWSRASAGSVPPRSDSSLSRRTMTPTKQISLQAVKRKEESSDPFVDDVDIDLDSISYDGSRQRRKKLSDDNGFRPLSENSFVEDELITRYLGVTDEDGNYSKDLPSASLVGENDTDFHSERMSENCPEDVTEKGVSAQKESSHKQEENRKEESSSDTDDDDNEEEKMKLRAPNELLMEFVDCLMKKDFTNAEKLCKMILLYEPENPEALKFKPLIEEKMKLDAEAAAEEGDSDDDEDDDDDDDDDDSDDDDDTSSSDEDSSEDEAEDEENIPVASEEVPSTSSQNQASKDVKGANSIRAWKPAS